MWLGLRAKYLTRKSQEKSAAKSKHCKSQSHVLTIGIKGRT